MSSVLDQAREWSDRVRCCRPPPAVQGLSAGSGGGSGEVVVTWDPLPAAAKVAFYRVYERKGTGTFWLLAIVTDAALDALEPGRLGIVDAADYWPWPTIGVPQRCYVVTAVSTRGLEGPMSAEICGSPP
jgi:hypothetical protein